MNAMDADKMNFDLYAENGNEKPDEASELFEWFSVLGDVDDFIYYGEEIKCSER